MWNWYCLHIRIPNWTEKQAKSRPNNGIIIQLNWNALKWIELKCQVNAMQFHQIKIYMQSPLHPVLFQWESFFFFFLNFCRTQVLFVGPLIPLFWTSGDVCPGFQSQGGFPHLRASSPAHNGFLRFTSGATPAFSTNRGVHCISVYTAWLARLLSHALGFEPESF